ncbi:MAG TPA: hypothetical protein VHY83_04750 [Solirubrobacteraceae bacterium]|nr:hypothetical protein [Solirubrobacteraceae bacterium]
MSTEEPRGLEGVPGEPSEEELRAAYEAELARLTSADLIAQAVVSLLNLGARRLGPVGGAPAGAGGEAGTGAAQGPGAGERDLGQVRDAIDAVRPLLEILERNVPEGVRPLRDALAQLQMAYAREVQASAQTGAGGGPGSDQGGSEPARGEAQGGEAAADGASSSEQKPGEPGPAQRSGRLWVPGS